MRLPALFAVALVAPAFAACLGPADDQATRAGGGTVAGGEDADVAGDLIDPGWPRLADAVIRPGVRVTSGAGSCTSNFVFKSPDNATLYLGLAAHCLRGQEENESVRIAGQVDATVAYNAWYTMSNNDNITGVPRSSNDFAIIEIPAESRHLVHPAMVHFGGPTGIAERGVPGERILTYGTSGYRQGIEPLNPREGYVDDSTDWYTTMTIITPGVWGDSGSAVLNSKAEALGILIHLRFSPATNGAGNLHAALEFAREWDGIDVEVATWPVLNPALLPDRP